jgi:hypothetical protein
MHKLILIAAALSLGAVASLQAQPKLLTDIRPKLFTLRNARLTLGFLYHGSFLSEDKQPLFQSVSGRLPANGKIEYAESAFPYLSGGLHLDWFSPNSRIGLDLGAEYNLHDFSISVAGETHQYAIGRLLVPAALRYRFGSVHSRNNTFLTAGAFYSMPLSLTRTSGSSEQTLNGVQQNALGLTSSIGYEVRLTKKQAEEQAAASKQQTGKAVLTSEYPRIWVFLRVDHLPGSLFTPGNSGRIIPGSSLDGFEISTTNISFGASFFFGGKLRLR